MYRMLFAALLAIGFVADAHAGPITYDIQSYLSQQNGFSLSGTITTDGTLGSLTAADITDWTYTITMGNITVTNSLAAAGPGGTGSTGILTATPTSLTLPIPTTATAAMFQNLLSLGLDNDPNASSLQWRVAIPVPALSLAGGDTYFGVLGGPAAQIAWNENTPDNTLPLPTAGDPFIIATVPAAAVPEPGSITLMLAGIGGLVGARLTRHRRQAAARR
jgi:hypothetical protein